MAKIIALAVPKQVQCNCCHALIEYMPEDVQVETINLMGDYDSTSYVKCPRAPGCPGKGVIKR